MKFYTLFAILIYLVSSCLGGKDEKGSVIVINNHGGGGGGGGDGIGHCGHGGGEATTIVKMNPKKGNTIIVKGGSGKKKKMETEQVHVPVPVPVPVHIHSGHHHQQQHGHQINHESTHNLLSYALGPQILSRQHHLQHPHPHLHQQHQHQHQQGIIDPNHHSANTDRRSSIDFPVFIKEESTSQQTAPAITSGSATVPVFVKDSSSSSSEQIADSPTARISMAVSPSSNVNSDPLTASSSVHLPIYTKV